MQRPIVLVKNEGNYISYTFPTEKTADAEFAKVVKIVTKELFMKPSIIKLKGRELKVPKWLTSYKPTGYEPKNNTSTFP